MHVWTKGQNAYPKGSVYCASKFAVRAITQSLRAETMAIPIKITEIDPGMVETNFSKVRFGGDSASAAKVYEGIVSWHIFIPFDNISVSE